MVTPGETAAATAQSTFTNNLTSVDLQIIKIDETTREQSTPTKLQGAQFQLFKYTVSDGSSTGSYTVYPNESDSVKTTDTNGALSFEGLPDGQYKISEKKPPDGYLKTGNNDIYFDIVQGTLTRYGSEYSGSERDPADAITGEANMITYESDNHAFIVGNTPGTELPKTGGIGTTLFTALGGLMMGTAGAILTLRKKKTKA